MTELVEDTGSETIMGIGLGTVIPAILSMLFGAVYMAAGGQGDLGQRVVAGLICGLAAVLVPAFGLAWHAYGVRHAPTRAETAALWGLIPAALIAGSLGPALGGVAGVQFDAVDQGITVGLFGLVAGPLAWEISYWFSGGVDVSAAPSEHGHSA